MLFGCFSSKTKQKSSSDSSFLSKTDFKLDSAKTKEEKIETVKKTAESFDIDIKVPGTTFYQKGELKNGKTINVFEEDTLETEYDKKTNILVTKVKIKPRIVKNKGFRIIEEKKTENVKTNVKVKINAEKQEKSEISKKNVIIDKKGIFSDWRTWTYLLIFILLLLAILLAYRKWRTNRP